MTKLQKSEHDEYLAKARKMLKVEDTIYTLLRNVSRSGMPRSISFYIMADNEPYCIDYIINKINGGKIDKHGGITMTGCGMDMGYHVVHNLSMKVFAKEEGKYDHDGAYALKHRWL